MLSRDDLTRLIKSGDPALIRLAAQYLDLAKSPYYTFQPRPDRPEDLDQQASFVNDTFAGLACALGGNAAGKSYAGAYKVAHFLRTTPPPRRQTQ
jgi:hypothetical protein